jgi:lipopolysaccharide/colanic/teichoic acid biosynthesis glycosyltransferase
MTPKFINTPRAIPNRRGYRIAKRAMDLTVCILLLPIVLPLGIMISILIYLDTPGPVIFVQSRTGLGAKRFRMYKFRTMVSNAEELKNQYSHLNELPLPDFKITDDPRVTRVGRFLRKTSLDELPQIINILKGDMSLVGPRPTSFGAETYSLKHTERLEVLPGLTGLWQIKGRSDLDFDERTKLDIEYIENQSMWLDIQILVLTIGAVVTKKGAK